MKLNYLDTTKECTPKLVTLQYNVQYTQKVDAFTQ